jgi:hypothetical protein
MTTHTCHWPNCGMHVPPKMFMCRRHWLILPADLRQRIWTNYQPGQEVTKRPSAEYIEAVKDVQQFIEQRKAKAA